MLRCNCCAVTTRYAEFVSGQFPASREPFPRTAGQTAPSSAGVLPHAAASRTLLAETKSAFCCSRTVLAENKSAFCCLISPRGQMRASGVAPSLSVAM